MPKTTNTKQTMCIVLEKPILELSRELKRNVMIVGTDRYYIENIGTMSGTSAFAFLMAKQKQNDYLIEWHFTVKSDNPPKVKISADLWGIGHLVPIEKSDWTETSNLYDLVFHKQSLPNEVKDLFPNVVYFGVEPLDR